MTRTRALLGALAVGSLSFGLATGASAQAVNTITGTVSQVEGACLGLLQVVGNPLCQYDNLPFPPGIFPGAGDSTGPITNGRHYAVGNSPWDNNGGPGDVGGVVGDGAIEVPLSGTVTIDDKGTACDADDTITADVAYGAATRNFAGGPGTQGEETWGDGDLGFQLAETVVDSAAANGGGGCDYVIGDAGAPTLLTTAGGGEYGDDLDPGGADIWIPNNGAGAYTGVTPSISSLETTANVGAPMTVTNGASYSCVFFSGGAVDCEDTGAHHEIATSDGGIGDRGAIENSIWVVSTDAGGNITSATVYPVAENPVGGFSQPQWNAPRWAFTGNAGGGVVATAVDDAAATLQNTGADIDVLANDTNFVDPVTVTIDTAPDNGGSATINGSPGNQDVVDISYLPAVDFVGTETFVYQVDDGVNTDTATVTVTVSADTVPVAPDGTLDLDTQGQQGAAAAASLDVSTLAGFAPGEGTPVCNITADGATGTATCVGTTVTYTPDDSFVNGGATDTFTYEIVDGLDAGQSDTGDITVTITNVQPALSYADIDTEVNTDGDSAATVTPGNGTPAQHTIAVSSDASDGACVVNGDFSVTYTPDADYEGADSCEVTLTDADGEDAVATVAITVSAAPPAGGGDNDIRLPGGKSAMDLFSLILLGGLPLLRRRKQR